MRRGNVYQIANGYMGYRGTLGRIRPRAIGGNHACRDLRPCRVGLAGACQCAEWRLHERFSWWSGTLRCWATRLRGTGRRFGLPTRCSNGRRYSPSKGTTLTIKSARFLSADTPNLGVIRFSITCNKAAKVTIRTGIDGNIWDLNGPHLLHDCG